MHHYVTYNTSKVSGAIAQASSAQDPGSHS